jgi:aspartyl-tRNA(Asn)/glutamyl-tRNA(Gln) amidotransferase subunit A
VPEFDEIGAVNAKGGLTAPESFAWHRALLAAKEALYDRRVSVRIKRGASMSAADYIDTLAARRGLIDRVTQRLSAFDALLMPSVAILPPAIAALATDDDAYTQANLMALRNASLINMIDGCALSLPIAAAGGAPVGLTVAGVAGADHRIFAVSAAIEALLA